MDLHLSHKSHVLYISCSTRFLGLVETPFDTFGLVQPCRRVFSIGKEILRSLEKLTNR